MNARTSSKKELASLVVVVAMASLSCGSEEPGPAPESPAGEWDGVIETEGDVTTVRTMSGSVWPGTASLVEEASIGVDLGEEPYMLGDVAGLHATDDEIHVLDSQVPVLRVYDMEGRHLRGIGAPGQGPGEFQRPRWVAGTSDGRILVTDEMNGRINVYGREGEPMGAWPMARGGEIRPRCCLRPMVTSGGTAWLEIGILNRERRRFDPGMRACGPEGPTGEPMTVPEFEYERWTLTIDGRELESVRMAPEIVWAIVPGGSMVAGASDDYTFEIRSPDGAVTRVERQWEPVPSIEEERRHGDRWIREVIAPGERGEERDLVWDGRLPETKPAFDWFLPTWSGEIWVVREGRAEAIPGCDPEETTESPNMPPGRGMPVRCFEFPWITDAFDLEGRYLGEVRVPDDALLSPSRTFIRGDLVLTAVQNEAGTTRVKRYRRVVTGR